jgi:glutamate--cysteine ligase
LDYRSEADAMRKLRLGLYLQPLVMAMFANSFLLDHKLRTGNCARSQIWLNTDPDRYLYPAEWLAENTSIMNYIEWAISTPMFFIARDGQYLNCAGLPFKQFMQEGFQGYQATMGDFELHLSTLFPDTRLKQHFEVRGADMSSPEYVKALSAFHVGLMYDETALESALAYFAPIQASDLWLARARLDQEGLKTHLGGQSFQTHCEFLLDLASSGLSRWEPQSQDLLKPLIQNIEKGLCPADINRSLWTKGYETLMRGTQVA